MQERFDQTKRTSKLAEMCSQAKLNKKHTIMEINEHVVGLINYYVGLRDWSLSTFKSPVMGSDRFCHYIGSVLNLRAQNA